LESVSGFLRELKKSLPDSDVQLVVDGEDGVSMAIARAAVALDVTVEAVVAPGTDSGTSADGADMLRHPRVERVEVAADIVGRGTRASKLADILLRRSSLLIALWDGTASREPDDTADIIFRFLESPVERGETVDKIAVATAFDELDVSMRPVFWVRLPRAGANRLESPQEARFILGADDNVLDVATSMPPSLKGLLADLNEFNRDYDRLASENRLAACESLMNGLSPEVAVRDCEFLEEINRQYVKADSLAGYMQRRSDRLFNLFGFMAFTMGTAYLVYDKITASRVLLIVYMLILFASLVAYYVLQGRRWFGKHLSYRALAETLRVRFYLSLAGIDRRIRTRQLIALTGIHRFPGFSWIGFVLDAIEPTIVEEPGTSDAHLRRARLVDDAWIENQYQYFARKVARMEGSGSKVKRLRMVMFIAVLIVISTMFIFGNSLQHVDAHTGLPMKNMITFCSGFLAVLLGVLELRRNKMATQELLWQYRSQLTQFQRARTQLKRITSRTRRDDVLMELGETSLMEIYLWAIHRYHREHAPPAGP
jgi:hypothetical protein